MTRRFGSRPQIIYVKEGQTLSLALTLTEQDGTTPFDLTGYTVTSQARTGGDVLVEDGAVTIDDAAAGQVTVEFDATGWAITNEAQQTFVDVLAKVAGNNVFTETLELGVLQSITAHD